jgi:hypothetical protein
MRQNKYSVVNLVVNGATLNYGYPRRTGRTLFLLCYGIALALIWASGKRDMLRLSLYFLPTAFLILMIGVRVAPFVVGPIMLAGKPPSHITTLNLHGTPSKGPNER